VDQLAPHLVMLEEVFRTAHRFDIVHFHIDYLHFPFSRRENIRQVTKSSICRRNSPIANASFIRRGSRSTAPCGGR
jgi:hypothetical protein